jgi:hypothetical protein
VKESRADVMRKAALEEAIRRKKGPDCRTCALSPEDRAFIVEMRAKGITYPAIAKGLRAVGVEVPQAALARHYREGHEQA